MCISVSQEDSLQRLKYKFSDLLPGKHYEYKTIYGKTYRHVLKQVHADYITFFLEGSSDTLRVLKQEIVSLYKIPDQPLKKRLRASRPYFSPYHIFTQNALNLDSIRGVGMHSHFLFFHDMGFKINNEWSIQSSIVIILPMSLGVRYSKKLFPNHTIGVNVNFFYFSDTGVTENRIIFPAIMNGGCRYTIGNPDHHFTLGAFAFAFHRDFLLALSYGNGKPISDVFRISPALYAGATERFHSRWVLNLEALYFLNAFGMAGVGIRYITKRNISLQLAVFGVYRSVIKTQPAGNLKTNPWIILPYFSYSFYIFKR